MSKPNNNLSLAAGAFEAINQNDTNRLQTLIDQCPPDITLHIFYISQPEKDSNVFNVLRKHLKQSENKHQDYDLSMDELEAEFNRLGITERIDDPDEQQDSMFTPK